MDHDDERSLPPRVGYLSLGDLLRLHHDLADEADTLQTQLLPEAQELAPPPSSPGSGRSYQIGRLSAMREFLDALGAFLMTWSADSAGDLDASLAAGERQGPLGGMQVRFLAVAGPLGTRAELERYLFSQLLDGSPLVLPVVPHHSRSDSPTQLELEVEAVPDLTSGRALLVQCRTLDEERAWVQIRAADQVEVVVATPRKDPGPASG